MGQIDRKWTSKCLFPRQQNNFSKKNKSNGFSIFGASKSECRLRRERNNFSIHRFPYRTHFYRQKMDWRNPSEKNIKVFVPALTYCLQSKKVFSIFRKVFNFSLVVKNRVEIQINGLSAELKLLNKRRVLKVQIIIALVITSTLLIAVHQSVLFRNEEKLVALLVYSLFIWVATSSFRIIPFSFALVVVCA